MKFESSIGKFMLVSIEQKIQTKNLKLVLTAGGLLLMLANTKTTFVPKTQTKNIRLFALPPTTQQRNSATKAIKKG